LYGKRDTHERTKLWKPGCLGQEGHKYALEGLVRRIQDQTYGLALRTLFLPADAEDATQEILIKIITHLAGFRGESRFTT
jgi:DNA-directed RNA polymerase specialized sigma24 family protein